MLDKSKLDTLFVDFPIVKEITRGGELKTYKNSEALTQAIKIWLVCQKGEKIRSLTGGILLPYLGRVLSENNANNIRKVIIRGLEEDFSPRLTIVDLKVTPDNNKNRWVIDLVGYNADLAIGVNSSIIVSNI